MYRSIDSSVFVCLFVCMSECTYPYICGLSHRNARPRSCWSKAIECHRKSHIHSTHAKRSLNVTYTRHELWCIVDDTFVHSFNRAKANYLLIGLMNDLWVCVVVALSTRLVLVSELACAPTVWRHEIRFIRSIPNSLCQLGVGGLLLSLSLTQCVCVSVFKFVYTSGFKDEKCPRVDQVCMYITMGAKPSRKEMIATVIYGDCHSPNPNPITRLSGWGDFPLKSLWFRQAYRVSIRWSKIKNCQLH